MRRTITANFGRTSTADCSERLDPNERDLPSAHFLATLTLSTISISVDFNKTTTLHYVRLNASSSLSSVPRTCIHLASYGPVLQTKPSQTLGLAPLSNLPSPTTRSCVNHSTSRMLGSLTVSQTCALDRLNA
jgi:hypothetical protein